MLLNIGAPPEAHDLVGLLLACHKRIRRFIELAVRLGARETVPREEVVDACRQCIRYFAEALPLHVQDEEESLLPRLRDNAALADNLELMHRQHEEHKAGLSELLSLLAHIENDPLQLGLRPRLHEVATKLQSEFEEHLNHEEQTIFVALQTLDAQQEEEILVEMRRRREAN